MTGTNRRLDDRQQAVLKGFRGLGLGLRRNVRSYAHNLHDCDSTSQLTAADSEFAHDDTTENYTLLAEVAEYSDASYDLSGSEESPSSSSSTLGAPQLSYQSPTGLSPEDFEYLHSHALERCTSLKELGQGGFGTVDLVEITLPSGRTIAAARKVIHSPLYGQARYERELKGLMLCAGCPFVVDVFTSRTTEEGTFEFLLEYAPNGTLHDMLKAMEQRRRGKDKLLMPEHRIRYYAACVLQGLLFIHKRGQAHRDVKPGNVLMSASGRPMLADTDSMDSVQVTKRAGTTSYQAPELWRASLQGPGYTADKADMYAFGITLAEMAACPAGGNGKLQQIKDDPASNTPGYVPADLKDLLCGLLAPAAKRLTVEQAMGHRFFVGLDWDNLSDGPLGFAVQLRQGP
ncbi:Serine/threonine-protein kinase Genghis Khan [Tetrabaena socialis]|uniref:Serine/threonine-protein kinase Genghis Khan n=1 Tax=Tetrabaena socialis TaxID=47790 RepID=A0A2J7ZRD0_9CHLO|nr:Serine/threonine-protein kinase Genghis Khan [Tetrabaena socialis]|eukprot:PNH02818.1 Serine/threonine-protein kinase Genghis Khan [Tetrabaena socialis]